jgi:hypothetical protein
MAEADSEQTDTQNEQVPENVETNTQPALNSDGDVVRLILAIEALLRIMDEASLRAVSTDGGQSGKGF